MTETIAGVAIPLTAAATRARDAAAELLSPLLLGHSWRVFLFASMHAERLGAAADPELLHLAALFHDTGLLHPFSDAVQRFEADGADHARRFLAAHGFPDDAADTVWTAIALHTTPGIPPRMGPEIASLHLGVLTDVTGSGRELLDPARVDEVLDAHPRGAFAEEFLRSAVAGMRDRPETANGTVNADILEHFLPEWHRTTTVERILGASSNS